MQYLFSKEKFVLKLFQEIDFFLKFKGKFICIIPDKEFIENSLGGENISNINFPDSNSVNISGNPSLFGKPYIFRYGYISYEEYLIDLDWLYKIMNEFGMKLIFKQNIGDEELKTTWKNKNFSYDNRVNNNNNNNNNNNDDKVSKYYNILVFEKIKDLK